MLKWTVIARRDTEQGPSDAKSSTTPRKSKRRRSSTNRRRSSLDSDKENQFTSTPIKATSSEGFMQQFDVLRDVSNLTPTDECRRVLSAKKCKSDKKSPGHRSLKKKKSCVSEHNPSDRDSTNYFRPFEVVDSHIEGILADDVYPNSFAPTVKSSSPKVAGDEQCPPNKKPKYDHVNDFLQQISFITSPEDKRMRFPGFRLKSSAKKLLQNEIKVSPLVKKFIDLRFGKMNFESKEKRNNNLHEDSSFINDLSLDEIVDAILETDECEKLKTSSTNTSIVVNVGDASELENENNMNETHEENLLNIEHERNRRTSFDGSSTDSGFRSTTENSHQLDSNYLCKCNNNNKQISGNITCDRTIININETYNERCVDDDNRLRKRTSETSLDADGEQPAKRPNLNKSIEENFTLRRQRCIRRKERVVLKPFLDKASSPILDTIVNDDSFECTPMNECYMENKEILQDAHASPEQMRSIRRCLMFDSPKQHEESCLSDSPVDARGTLDLNIQSEDDTIQVHVIRCKDLYKADGKVNAYVKVAIGDRFGESRRKRTGGTLQRTAVQADSLRPLFNHTFRFPKPASFDQTNKRIHIEVWHRDRNSRTSELLGCMSFDVKDVCEKGVNGSYRLLPQSTGRGQNQPITQSTTNFPLSTATTTTTMCESHSSMEEVLTLDGDLEELSRSTCNRAALIEQQKHADENLFLRYLELDPTEGPDSAAAATQRKATGNKFGRTPFTHTKKLIRPAKSGFGFSVVWTHPPRIERVEKGLPADKAGILPGDYIIFVDKHNVVMMPEIDILNLIRSYGSQLTLEIFRRNPSRNGSVPSVRRLVTPSAITQSSTTSTNANTASNINLTLSNSAATATTIQAAAMVPMTISTPQQRRPSTVCSTNTASVDYSRRKLHLPQVTFSSEKQTNNPEENKKKAMYQLISKEQTYATAMQYAMTRFVSSLAERRDLITPQEHRQLFQNSEEILRITEDILDQLLQDDGDPQINLIGRTYQSKLTEITSAYKRYCCGIKRADCILASKTKNTNSEFVRFVQVPAVPKRRPDITTFIHKPLEHYREVLKMFTVIQGCTKASHEDHTVINQIIHDLQLTYREITSEAGLMEPIGEGRPLLTVQDLENRLVFTKCKPFVLNKPGRQWIFGGDLSRVEGRNVRQYWTLLFSDLLLFAKVSRDRVLFIIEDPLPLSHITDMFFNVRKKDTEFRITISPDGKLATSPTVHCGPDLSRTPRKNANKRTVILRAPTAELKAVWQNLLQRQIFHINSGMDGSSYSSPIESPTDAPITSSVVTLQSAESLSLRQRQTGQNANVNNEHESNREIERQIDVLIELKCKQLSKSSFNSKCNAIHLEKWMKGQLDGGGGADTTAYHPDIEMDLLEEWTEEMVRKRSEELHLLDAQGNLMHVHGLENCKRSETRCEEYAISEHSPSKSTTTESQVTVRSSPQLAEPVQFCRQCHKNCLTNGNAKAFDHNHLPDSPSHHQLDDKEPDDWQPLLLLGLCGANPAASLVKMDPFQTPCPVPKIAVVPATPESSIKTQVSDRLKDEAACKCQTNMNSKPHVNSIDLSNEVDVSPDDSPQTEEHPYRSLSSSVATLRRFGTVSSLERVGSEEQEDRESILSSETDPGEHQSDVGIDNEAFNHGSGMSWTERAGTFVAEKMAFFEKLGEDYRTGGRFFERYLKTTDNPVNGDDGQEEVTSGTTSGEEIWGTPTSGGDLDDSLTSPNYEGKQSPNDGSISSDNGEDTELMMDELLMTPPITGAIIRGLLPRRTLEPLIEEDFSETSSSSDITSPTEPSISPEQGNGTGDVADTCSTAAAKDPPTPTTPTTPTDAGPRPSPPISDTGSYGKATATTPPLIFKKSPPKETSSKNVEDAVIRKIPRSESYRRIIEAAEDGDGEDICFFNRFKPAMTLGSIERVPRSRSIKIFEFFNVRRAERRIYETYPEDKHLLKLLHRDNGDNGRASLTEKPVSPRRLEDKRLDRRFWKQLSRRRSSQKAANFPT